MLEITAGQKSDGQGYAHLTYPISQQLIEKEDVSIAKIE